MTNILVSAALIFALQGAETDFSNRPRPGDSGDAFGILQIHQEVIADVNRVYGTHYTLDDAKIPRTARVICTKYLQHWGKRYMKDTGRKPTDEVLARIWNGGPYGYNKDATRYYWARVQRNWGKRPL